MRRVLKAIWSDEQDREGHFRQVRIVDRGVFGELQVAGYD